MSQTLLEWIPWKAYLSKDRTAEVNVKINSVANGNRSPVRVSMGGSDPAKREPYRTPFHRDREFSLPNGQYMGLKDLPGDRLSWKSG